MANIRFKIQHTTHKPFQEVYNSLYDFKIFGRLHPCMKKVDVVEHAADHIVYAIEEEVYLFGFIKIKPAYHANVFEREKGKCLQYTSQVRKNIYLSMCFTFSENGNSSLIVLEDIELCCNRLVGFIFLNILKKAHHEVFRNLER